MSRYVSVARFERSRLLIIRKKSLAKKGHGKQKSLKFLFQHYFEGSRHSVEMIHTASRKSGKRLKFCQILPTLSPWQQTHAVFPRTRGNLFPKNYRTTDLFRVNQIDPDVTPNTEEPRALNSLQLLPFKRPVCFILMKTALMASHNQHYRNKSFKTNPRVPLKPFQTPQE